MKPIVYHHAVVDELHGSGGKPGEFLWTSVMQDLESCRTCPPRAVLSMLHLDFFSVAAFKSILVGFVVTRHNTNAMTS